MEWILLFIVALYYFDKSVNKKDNDAEPGESGGGGNIYPEEPEAPTPSEPSVPETSPSENLKKKIDAEYARTGKVDSYENLTKNLDPAPGRSRQQFIGRKKKPYKNS